MNLEKPDRPTIWNGIFCSYNNWLVGYLFDCLVDLRAIEVFFSPAIRIVLYLIQWYMSFNVNLPMLQCLYIVILCGNAYILFLCTDSVLIDLPFTL